MRKNILTVKSLMQGISIFTITFLVSCEQDDSLPLATAAFDFTATTDVVGQAPLNVQFTNDSENAESYLWDFGDGATSTDPAPIHVYLKGGDYVVSLTAINGDGKESVDEGTITLASPLAGAWVLDSMAAPTIDSIAVTQRFTGAFEFGVSHADAPCPGQNLSSVTAWSPDAGWKAVLFNEDSPAGYFSFWSEVIFKGNYFGRKDFFENEFIFSSDGSYAVDLKGELIFPDFMVSTEAEYQESDDWTNIAGAAGDLSGFKSSDAYTFSVVESTDHPGYGELTLMGEGAFLGSYFSGFVATAGGTETGRLPQSEYRYIISSVSSDQLIVGGFAGDILCASDWVVLKFKKVN